MAWAKTRTPGATRLSNNDVQIIRDMLAANANQGDIAVRFGVSRAHISNIKANRTRVGKKRGAQPGNTNAARGIKVMGET